MIALSANIALAFLWLMLSSTPSLYTFFIGYLIGFVLIAVFSKILGGKTYIRKTAGFIRFIFIFLYAFFRANLEVAKIVLFVPSSQVKAAFVDYSIKDLYFYEALILSHCITLTPGTITASLNWEEKNLVVHVLDAADPKGVENEIDRILKQPILRFTR